AIDVDNGTPVNANKHLGIENFLKLANTGRTYELVVLGSEDGVVTRRLEVNDFLDRQVKQLLRLLNENVVVIRSLVFRFDATQQLAHVILFVFHEVDSPLAGRPDEHQLQGIKQS